MEVNSLFSRAQFNVNLPESFHVIPDDHRRNEFSVQSKIGCNGEKRGWNIHQTKIGAEVAGEGRATN